jgi:Cys-rich protein (TIGR01571 family)
MWVRFNRAVRESVSGSISYLGTEYYRVDISLVDCLFLSHRPLIVPFPRETLVLCVVAPLNTARRCDSNKFKKPPLFDNIHIMAAPASSTWRNGLFGQVCGGDCSTCVRLPISKNPSPLIPPTNTLLTQLGAWFCYPCLHGRISSRTAIFPSTSSSKITTLNSDCGLAYLLGCCGLSFLPIMQKRTAIREKFGISGNFLEDCLVTCCCQPCALAQMSTELKDRSGAIALLLPEDDGRRGYVSPGTAEGGMRYSDVEPVALEEGREAYSDEATR